MTQNMVERVAEAILRVDLFSRYNDWTSDHVPGLPIEIFRYGGGDEPEIVVVERFPAEVGEDTALIKAEANARARAAILAMREPTEAMVASGIARVEECTSGWSCVAPCSAEHAWQVMINAALDEKEGGE